MAKVWSSLFGGGKPEKRMTVDGWANQWMSHQGQGYPLGGGYGASGNSNYETVENSFEGYIRQAMKSDGVVFACMVARMRLFSQARFQWQKMREGRPGDLFGTKELGLLEAPWEGAGTIDLLNRAISQADLSGNHYAVREGPNRVRVLRPDWVDIVLTNPPEEAVETDVAGWIFKPGGTEDREKWQFYVAGDWRFAHWAPTPDPEAMFRGMSWLTPVIREVMADKAATKHKGKFFENAATPSFAMSFKETVTAEQFREFKAAMQETHQGADNAYKPLYVGGGADIKPLMYDMRQLDFKATQGAGEPLALDTPIPTPSGWTTMGEIGPGDQVIGRDGKPANVVGVSPIHENRDCFRVTLKDRTSIVADASHLWVATDRNTAKRQERKYTTQELFDIFTEQYSNGVGGHRLFLPQTPMVELPEQELLIDPYVLGAWLGDGQTSGAAICGARDDLKFVAHEIESRGYRTSLWQTGEGKVDVIGIPGGLLAALRAEGVLSDKKIPQVYLRSSVAQRLDLLRGLMDTDGTVDPSRGQCEFSSKWKRLAQQVVELVRSLGYRATLSIKADSRSRTGETWRVFFRVEQDRIPFLLPRKVDRCIAAGDPKVSNRSIVAIERVESVPVRCIAVDTEDHLFLAGEGFVPTHNTRIAAAARVHPVIVGLSEGMQGSSLNAGNFKAAKDAWGDGELRPLWASLCQAYSALVKVPEGARLWYDDRDISFLREDLVQKAQVMKEEAQAMTRLVQDGFTWETARDAIKEGGDWSLLKHTGLFSVQLQPPMPNGPPTAQPMKPATGPGAAGRPAIGQQRPGAKPPAQAKQPAAKPAAPKPKQGAKRDGVPEAGPEEEGREEARPGEEAAGGPEREAEARTEAPGEEGREEALPAEEEVEGE